MAKLMWKTPSLRKEDRLAMYGNAAEVVRSCDMTVAVLGINKSIEREGQDRSSISLPADQEEFIQAIDELNPNTVVVLIAGSSLAINWMNDHIPAIVNAWYPGEQGGTAIAEVLFGDYNQARRENKGQESAASRFISSDIQEVIKGLNTVRVNNRVLTDDDYKSTEDDIFHLVEFMTGRRDLPKGKNFGDEIKATQEKIGAYVRTVEPAFRDTFVPFMRALAEQAKKDGNVIKGDDHKAAAPSEGAQNVEIEGEIDPKTGLMKKA